MRRNWRLFLRQIYILESIELAADSVQIPMPQCLEAFK